MKVEIRYPQVYQPVYKCLDPPDHWGVYKALEKRAELQEGELSGGRSTDRSEKHYALIIMKLPKLAVKYIKSKKYDSYRKDIKYNKNQVAQGLICILFLLVSLFLKHYWN